MSLLVLSHPNLDPSGRVAPFRHDPLGRLLPLLRRARPNLSLQHASYIAEPGPPSLGPEALSGLIVLGGPQSVNCREEWLDSEYDFLEKAVRLRLPVFCICLGAQLLAKVLGAKVLSSPQPEFGWRVVLPTADAAQDPMFSHFAPQPVFQWHAEAFTLPAGATWLLTSEVCPYQAFRYDNAWAVQFHPEVTPAIVQEWCDLDETFGENRDLPAPLDPFAEPPNARAVAEIPFLRWLDRLPL